MAIKKYHNYRSDCSVVGNNPFKNLQQWGEKNINFNKSLNVRLSLQDLFFIHHVNINKIKHQIEACVTVCSGQTLVFTEASQRNLRWAWNTL